MPKRIKAETRDKKLTIPQLKKILTYLDIKGRAMVLFLLSSGARVGETVKLKIVDFDIENDPPRAHIRAEYTKGGVGARTVYFSHEAKEAIKDWLTIKDGMKKRNGGTFSKDKVFDWTVGTATYLWNRAIKKADLDIKDGVTQRRIYHLHGLRKFFRTKIGLDLDITHALMGHSEYLDDSYLRLDETGEIAIAYQEAMSNVSVYAVENTELKQETQNLKEEMQKLRDKEETKDETIAQLEKQLTYFKSPKFFKDIRLNLEQMSVPLETSKKSVKVHQVKIKLDDGKRLAKLMREGYAPTYNDDEIWILEKEIEE